MARRSRPAGGAGGVIQLAGGRVCVIALVMLSQHQAMFLGLRAEQAAWIDPRQVHAVGQWRTQHLVGNAERVDRASAPPRSIVRSLTARVIGPMTSVLLEIAGQASIWCSA